MFSRDQILALMRERVHHPAGVRELLQLLKVPREERASFKRHIKSLRALDEQLEECTHAAEAPLTDDQKKSVLKYLNEQFYKFK